MTLLNNSRRSFRRELAQASASIVCHKAHKENHLCRFQSAPKSRILKVNAGLRNEPNGALRSVTRSADRQFAKRTQQHPPLCHSATKTAIAKRTQRRASLCHSFAETAICESKSTAPFARSLEDRGNAAAESRDTIRRVTDSRRRRVRFVGSRFGWVFRARKMEARW
jgi:hypothetical protein